MFRKADNQVHRRPSTRWAAANADGEPQLPTAHESGLPIPNSFDFAPVLRKLSTKRPVFHSVADFQHALAWQIHF